MVGGRTAAALWVLPPGPVQYCSKHSCVAAVKLFSPAVLLISKNCIHIAGSRSYTKFINIKSEFICGTNAYEHFYFCFIRDPLVIQCNCLYVDDNICSPIPGGVQLSYEEINDCHSRNAMFSEWIELSVSVKQVNKTKSDPFAFKSPHLPWVSRGCEVEYPVGVKSDIFRPQLRKSRVKSHWRVVIQRNSLSLDVYIYIYIYRERERQIDRDRQRKKERQAVTEINKQINWKREWGEREREFVSESEKTRSIMRSTPTGRFSTYDLTEFFREK